MPSAFGPAWWPVLVDRLSQWTRGSSMASDHSGRLVGAAVADDEQLEVGEGLVEHRADRERQDRRPVVRRHHDRHPRHEPPDLHVDAGLGHHQRNGTICSASGDS